MDPQEHGKRLGNFVGTVLAACVTVLILLGTFAVGLKLFRWGMGP